MPGHPQESARDVTVTHSATSIPRHFSRALGHQPPNSEVSSNLPPHPWGAEFTPYPLFLGISSRLVRCPRNACHGFASPPAPQKKSTIHRLPMPREILEFKISASNRSKVKSITTTFLSSHLRSLTPTLHLEPTSDLVWSDDQNLGAFLLPRWAMIT